MKKISDKSDNQNQIFIFFTYKNKKFVFDSGQYQEKFINCI